MSTRAVEIRGGRFDGARVYVPADVDTRPLLRWLELVDPDGFEPDILTALSGLERPGSFPLRLELMRDESGRVTHLRPRDRRHRWVDL